MAFSKSFPDSASFPVLSRSRNQASGNHTIMASASSVSFTPTAQEFPFAAEAGITRIENAIAMVSTVEIIRVQNRFFIRSVFLSLFDTSNVPHPCTQPCLCALGAICLHHYTPPPHVKVKTFSHSLVVVHNPAGKNFLFRTKRPPCTCTAALFFDCTLPKRTKTPAPQQSKCSAGEEEVFSSGSCSAAHQRAETYLCRVLRTAPGPAYSSAAMLSIFSPRPAS